MSRRCQLHNPSYMACTEKRYLHRPAHDDGGELGGLEGSQLKRALVQDLPKTFTHHLVRGLCGSSGGRIRARGPFCDRHVLCCCLPAESLVSATLRHTIMFLRLQATTRFENPLSRLRSVFRLLALRHRACTSSDPIKAFAEAVDRLQRNNRNMKHIANRTRVR